jgi:hypothetical protein
VADTVDTRPLSAILAGSDNAFAQWLGRARRGLTLVELAAAVAEVNEAVVRTGKAGKVVLTVSVRPATKGSSNAVEVADTIRAEVPSPDRDSTLLFVSDDNGYSVRDPRQPALPGTDTD